jgi:hypothetical protein
MWWAWPTGDSWEYFLSLAEEGLDGGCSMVDANFFFGAELFMTVLMENREAREVAAEKSGASSSSEIEEDKKCKVSSENLHVDCSSEDMDERERGRVSSQQNRYRCISGSAFC